MTPLKPVTLPPERPPSPVTLPGTQVSETHSRRWSSRDLSSHPAGANNSTAAGSRFWTVITDTPPPLLRPPSTATGPSSPPEELQLNALDSSSVLVSWRPPLEPNGIIIGYRLLFSGNLSQPEPSWEKLYQDGG